MITFVVYQILIILMAVASAFFSSSEIAVLSANKYLIEEKADKKVFGARSAAFLLANSEKTLSMILIGNNIANICATVFITYLVTVHYGYGRNSLTAQVTVPLLQSVIFLLLCEIIPKVFSRTNPNRFLLTFGVVLNFLMAILSPFLVVISHITEFVKKFLRIGDAVDTKSRARNEIETLFQMGEKAGILEANHRIYVDEILSLHKIRVRQVMTPTIEVQSVEKRQSISSIIKLLDKTKFSRLPVHDERVDNIIGYVYYKDLYGHNNLDMTIEEIMRDPVYVPANKKIYELYTEMQKTNNYMVFVVNEFGAVEGLATREDIAEEIVGEIQTTDHLTEELIVKNDTDQYSVKATMDIEYFCRLFSVTIQKEGFETLAGFMLTQAGHIPKVGETINFKHLQLKVESATDKAIERVIVTAKNRKK